MAREVFVFSDKTYEYEIIYYYICGVCDACVFCGGKRK